MSWCVYGLSKWNKRWKWWKKEYIPERREGVTGEGSRRVYCGFFLGKIKSFYIYLCECRLFLRGLKRVPGLRFGWEVKDDDNVEQTGMCVTLWCVVFWGICVKNCEGFLGSQACDGRVCLVVCLVLCGVDVIIDGKSAAKEWIHGFCQTEWDRFVQCRCLLFLFLSVTGVWFFLLSYN